MREELITGRGERQEKSGYTGGGRSLFFYREGWKRGGRKKAAWYNAASEEKRMNNLNSILIEGVLAGDPELSYSEVCSTKWAFCKFTISHERSFPEGGEMKKKLFTFEVQTRGRLAETCKEYLRKGRGVRIVGRLEEVRWLEDLGEGEMAEHDEVFIVAEHVEFKPEKKKVEEEK
jgi:single-strand DNA-binding protein